MGRMGERDERGRLRLPRQDLVPFQRVLTRSNRSSRRPTPDEGGGGGNGNLSRSHSYNGQEVSRSLAKLSINRRKERTHSLPQAAGATSTGMPHIPFQRVLHRRRNTMLQPQPSEEVPPQLRYREMRDHRDRTTLPFTTEYNSKFRSGQQVRSRRRPSRQKNQSQLNSFLRDPTLQQPQEVEAGLARSPHSHSGGSSHPSDPPSSSSVKLPRIRDSPLMAPHSPRGVNGESEADTRPDTRPSTQPESRSGRRSNTHQDSRPNTELQPNTEPRPVTEPRPITEPRPNTEPRPITEPRPVSRAESRPEDSNPGTHTDVYTVPSPGPPSNPGTPPHLQSS